MGGLFNSGMGSSSINVVGVPTNPIAFLKTNSGGIKKETSSSATNSIRKRSKSKLVQGGGT
jgi:hypothetical protein